MTQTFAISQRLQTLQCARSMARASEKPSCRSYPVSLATVSTSGIGGRANDCRIGPTNLSRHHDAPRRLRDVSSIASRIIIVGDAAFTVTASAFAPKGLFLRQDFPARPHVNRVGVTAPSVRYRTIRGIDSHDQHPFAGRFDIALDERSQLHRRDVVSFAGINKAPQPLPAIRGCATARYLAHPRLYLNLPGMTAKARGGVSVREEQSTRPPYKNRSDAAAPGTARLRLTHVENLIVRRAPPHSREGA